MEVLKKRLDTANKGTYHKVLIIGGSFAYPGSILLAADGALDSGVGYVALGVEKKLYPIIACQIKEVIYEIFPSFSNKKKLKEVLNKYSSICFGNGIEDDKEAKKALTYILQNYKNRLLIDATGLKILKEIGLDLLLKAHCEIMLTPHLKEFSYLTNINVENKRAKDISLEAKKFAKKYHVCLVLKDYESIITDGNGYYVITRGNSGLAHAGSGDVLAGFLSGLMAHSPASLVDIAYFGHDIFSYAADMVSKDISLHAMRPSDVAKMLRQTLKKEKY